MSVYPSKGEVWLASLPEGFGHEQKGERPVVIVAGVERFGVVCAIPLTSTPHAETFPHAFVIRKSKENGLSVDSTALGIQITSFSELRFLRKIGVLDESDFKKVQAVVKSYLGL